MDEHTYPVSPELARAQLETAATAQAGTARDRWIDGTATILFGLLWGGWFTFAGRSDDVGLLDLVMLATVVVVAGGIVLLRARATTVPRHSARAMSVGTSVSVAVIIALTFTPLPDLDQPWLELLKAGLAAAPIVLAGLWIMVRR